MQNPSHQHWAAVKRIFRYIKRTLTSGIMFDGSQQNTILSGYADADWGGEIEKLKVANRHLVLCFTLAEDL